MRFPNVTDFGAPEKGKMMEELLQSFGDVW
jgi:hypothetical protein